ncbi:MAG: transketolase [Candidatus Gygaella obscura]|nr:transketolase [Candidatus Gygaella obscura]
MKTKINYSSQDLEQLKCISTKIRCNIVKMIANAKSGHPGGSLSSTELLTVLFFKVMKYDVKRLDWGERDRFHLSKGHCCPLWYAVLAEAGYFSAEELKTLRKLGTFLQGHPDRRTPGVDVASGSLGQGLSVALGMSLAAKMDNLDYRVYCLMGDGEMQEGNIWEAAMAAAHYKCDNICALLDYNGFQIDGRVVDVMNLEPIVDKWRAFGWHTISIDGHDMKQILDAYNEAITVKLKPTIIIARTIKGKGVSCMENVCDFHGRAPNVEETKQALEDLGEN